MSQQTLFALCLVAGLVALVSCQQLNMQNCSKSIRKQAELYRNNLMQVTERFTNSMQNTAGQAMDTGFLQEDLDRMTDSITKLTDMSNGFDMGRLTSVYMENLQTMASMASKSMRFNLLSGGMGSYLDFLNSVMRVNTEFMRDVSEACMPRQR